MDSQHAGRAQFIDRAFDWLLKNIKFFDPFVYGDKLDPGRSKAFNELAFIGMYLARYFSVESDERLVKILDFLEPIAQRAVYRASLMRQPSMFLLYSMVYIALEACGRPDPRQRFAIQQLVDIGYVLATERIPYRKIELHYFLDCGRYSHHLPDYRSLYEETLIYHPVPVLYLTNIDVYSITHALFYLADFGQRDLSAILNERFEATCETLTLLLGMYTRLRDWDIVSELLICFYCLKRRPSPLFDLAWQGVLGAQTMLGDVPGRYFNLNSRQLSQPETASAYRFEQNYHSTLIAMLACVLENHREVPA
jgi:hypothetical protein